MQMNNTKSLRNILYGFSLLVDMNAKELVEKLMAFGKNTALGMERKFLLIADEVYE